jgi:hypothetical protein
MRLVAQSAADNVGQLPVVSMGRAPVMKRATRRDWRSSP